MILDVVLSVVDVEIVLVLAVPAVVVVVDAGLALLLLLLKLAVTHHTTTFADSTKVVEEDVGSIDDSTRLQLQ